MIPLYDLIEAQNILGHPLGQRRSDPRLAQAAIRGHLGLRSTTRTPLPGKIAPVVSTPTARLHDASNAIGQTEIRDALRARGVTEAARRALARIRRKRTWYLSAAAQVDQDGYPACVPATGEEWEYCEPLRSSHSLGFKTLYAMCKAIDGDNEDGTWAATLLQVYQNIGKVKSSWWWHGPADNEAIDWWLLNVGPLWFGVYMQESMFRTVDGDPRSDRITRPNGTYEYSLKVRGKHFVECIGEKRYGHEMLVIGTDRGRNTRTLGNHWGLQNWGINGRAEITDEDFADHLENGYADLFGVVEQRAAA